MAIPEASVIIPAFNAEKTIEKAIQSVLNQDFSEPVQIIVIDDQSTDNTKAIVESLSLDHPEIELLENSGTKGPSGARNTGLKYAKGKFIAFLDADDVWYRNHLLEGVSCLRAYPNIDLISFNVDIIQLPENKIVRNWFSQHRHLERFKLKPIGDQIYLFEEDLIALFLRGCFLLWPATVVRRSVLEGLFFNEKVRYSEDRDLFLRLVFQRSCTIALKNVVTSIYYRHANNLTAPTIQNWLSLIDDELYLYRSYYDKFSYQYTSLISDRISKLYILKSRYLRRAGKPSKSFPVLYKCLKLGITKNLIIEFLKVVIYLLGYRYELNPKLF